MGGGGVHVRLDAVSKVFRHGRAEVVALDKVSLSVAAGEFVVLVGASGCGKSTLLNLVAGLLEPTHGSIARAPELEQRGGIGMVFQNPVLLPWRSVEDNILLPAEVFGVARAPFAARARALIELTGLSGFE